MNGPMPTGRHPGVSCAECGKPFWLFLGKPKMIEKLPDPFHMVCPHCRQEATYPKSAIQILAATTATDGQ